jgi:hypothetical protein
MHKEVVIKFIQMEELELLNTQLTSTAEHDIASQEDLKEFLTDIQKLIIESKAHYETKEELTDFGFRAKKVSIKAFSLSQDLLANMKKIKKNYVS